MIVPDKGGLTGRVGWNVEIVCRGPSYPGECCVRRGPSRDDEETMTVVAHLDTTAQREPSQSSQVNTIKHQVLGAPLTLIFKLNLIFNFDIFHNFVGANFRI